MSHVSHCANQQPLSIAQLARNRSKERLTVVVSVIRMSLVRLRLERVCVRTRLTFAHPIAPSLLCGEIFPLRPFHGAEEAVAHGLRGPKRLYSSR